MSDREDTSEDTQLPTPASTPAPVPENGKIDVESQIESDNSSSSETAHSAHTTVPSHPITAPAMATTTPIDTDTPAQRQSIKVTSILHKIAITTKLSTSNYVSWSDGVRFGLMAASYDIYLDSEDAGSSGIDPEVILATKKSLFHWLLASIEPAESTRFISMISTFENGIKTTIPSPCLLWKTIRDYHISNSESVKLMLRSEITDLSQGSTKDLLEYIDIFRAKVDAYLGSNGEMSEEEQARQFVRSLNLALPNQPKQVTADVMEDGKLVTRTSASVEITLRNLMINPSAFIIPETRLRWTIGNAQSARLVNG
ncbi:uncharacterized protein MELLADRAFT_62417 [Melampsora larici-populina 98AG31]|uniref:Uncharacterized protein n=1 Tax=Melampsora larici-populina (strain 98AG31 / pathotype 3-4-7) TaxID=747676 RepID=F4RIW4_MELLP|nr:uncharacterized protein MELLADRAFT_62417 [Melampsora larici-populina 98AG31]EGG07633.1 hypothetical protein MELLADRAFT_62417 [Melampsora larici-populina 98AG31]